MEAARECDIVELIFPERELGVTGYRDRRDLVGNTDVFSLSTIRKERPLTSDLFPMLFKDRLLR